MDDVTTNSHLSHAKITNFPSNFQILLETWHVWILVTNSLGKPEIKPSGLAASL